MKAMVKLFALGAATAGALVLSAGVEPDFGDPQPHSRLGTAPLGVAINEEAVDGGLKVGDAPCNETQRNSLLG